MVAQGVLPFESVPETSKTTLTGLAGLPVYLDLAAVIGLRESIERHVDPVVTPSMTCGSWKATRVLGVFCAARRLRGCLVGSVARRSGGFARIGSVRSWRTCAVG
ncbi:MAG: hypothetical protein CME06_06415 [Gemmatimonadetes bacterium]|nr:hypothetical protein [Gemmatimonadota bacterium]